MKKITVLELCAGAGGQALGFEDAGYEHVGLVELDSHACKTLRFNRPAWNVIQEDLNNFDASSYSGVDVIAAGLPCPRQHASGEGLLPRLGAPPRSRGVSRSQYGKRDDSAAGQ